MNNGLQLCVLSIIMDITNLSIFTKYFVSDANFKKQVLRQLQIINIRQQQMSEDVSMLLMKANSEKNEPIVSNEDSIFKTYNFPLKTVPELEELEEFLIQDENFNTFVSKFIY